MGPREAVVLVVRDVLMSLFEQLFGAVQAAHVIETRVQRRMVVQMLAVVDGGLLDFRNGFVDAVNRVLFFLAQLATAADF